MERCTVLKFISNVHYLCAKKSNATISGLRKAPKQVKGPLMTAAFIPDFYKAIELQFDSSAYDEKVDIWSVAMIVCELIYGKILFSDSGNLMFIMRILQDCGPMKDNTLTKIEPRLRDRIRKLSAKRIDFINYMKEHSEGKERIIYTMGSEDESNLRDFLEKTLQLVLYNSTIYNWIPVTGCLPMRR
ncbi:hypothetical protein PMAYCL1PPCAC_09454 [Pristionchus mayeri]|uniref:Protein kinase n=1 Tax=Pristionchus mayeri TaxID=1317129 RepID=A0AAN5CDZ8_9BILA|nr:hypothetical protein PMAYCL1PPCAC_09454 [Pristionchus mayeri]